MHFIKKIIGQTTGYWLHKLIDLPVGADLFVDIAHKLRYPSIQTIFDVGANIGQANRYFRYHVPDVRIYSFEPVWSTFDQLKQITGSDSNCVLEQLALGDEAGEKTIRLYDADMTVLNSLRDDVMNNAANAREERIKIDTLDHYCSVQNINKIDLLKIDTEGFEINVWQIQVFNATIVH